MVEGFLTSELPASYTRANDRSPKPHAPSSSILLVSFQRDMLHSMPGVTSPASLMRYDSSICRRHFHGTCLTFVYVCEDLHQIQLSQKPPSTILELARARALMNFNFNTIIADTRFTSCQDPNRQCTVVEESKFGFGRHGGLAEIICAASVLEGA